MTFASPHKNQHIVLRLDLKLLAFPAACEQAAFRTVGYPEQVADRLGGICSNAAPPSVWNNRPMEIAVTEWHEAQVLYARPHLPQGAPTSPSLANLTAFAWIAAFPVWPVSGSRIHSLCGRSCILGR